jgi:hypothetical protein
MVWASMTGAVHCLSKWTITSGHLNKHPVGVGIRAGTAWRGRHRDHHDTFSKPSRWQGPCSKSHYRITFTCFMMMLSGNVSDVCAGGSVRGDASGAPVPVYTCARCPIPQLGVILEAVSFGPGGTSPDHPYRRFLRPTGFALFGGLLDRGDDPCQTATG